MMIPRIIPMKVFEINRAIRMKELIAYMVYADPLMVLISQRRDFTPIMLSSNVMTMLKQANNAVVLIR